MGKGLSGLVLGLILGTIVGWQVLPGESGRSVRPRIVDGRTTIVNFDGTAFGFEGTGWRFPGSSPLTTQFESTDGVWSDESCLVPKSSGQPLQIGVIDVKPVDDAAGGPVAVWIRCLGEPTEVRS